MNKVNRYQKVTSILCLLFLLTACAQIQSFIGGDTPTKIGLRFVKTFNSEFDRTMKMALNPALTPQAKELILLQIKDVNLSDDFKKDLIAKNINPNLTQKEKEIINMRRAILIQAKPLIDLYVEIVQSGGTPSSLDEQKIEELLTRLLSLI